MKRDAFRDSLHERLPPKNIPPPLRALWWAAKGDWNRAHAHYWYARAGSQLPTTSTEAEWDAIVETLLADAE
jgi:hypothetical protein